MDCKRCGYAESHREHVRLCVQGEQAAGTKPVASRGTGSVAPPETKPATKPVAPAPLPVPAEQHGCPVPGCSHGHARSSTERSQALRERRRAQT